MLSLNMDIIMYDIHYDTNSHIIKLIYIHICTYNYIYLLHIYLKKPRKRQKLKKYA